MATNYVNINEDREEDVSTNGTVRQTTTSPITSVKTVKGSRPGRLLKRSTGRSLVNHRRREPKSWFGFFKDGFTTVINVDWYWIIALFAALYIVSWFVFGLVWWTVNATYEAVSNVTCISNVEGFSSSFLFSLETQMTIGYGFRYITRECSFGIFILIIQCVIGLLIDSFLLGLIFTKISRPRNRRSTILFSDLACINEDSESGKRHLQFRIADIREESSLVEAHVRVQLYWYKEGGTRGERVLYSEDLEVGYETGRDRIILLTPVIVTHVINESSPLSTLNEDNCLSQDIELVVILEAIVESTGLTAQALWSYTERELMFGYQFKPMTYRKADGDWEANFNLISDVVPIRPTESAM